LRVLIVPSERRDIRSASKLKLASQKGISSLDFMSATVPRMINWLHLKHSIYLLLAIIGYVCYNNYGAK
jgi:hypothetical protein